MSIHDPLAVWEDHEACWRMNYRGSLGTNDIFNFTKKIINYYYYFEIIIFFREIIGESLLHILIICDTLVHTKIARILLKVFPRCALDMIEGEEYLGATGNY